MRCIILLLSLFLAYPAEARDDRVLYEQIVERVQNGEPYYKAAAEELRDGGYPLRPVPAFRPPTLAVALAQLPSHLARLVALLTLCVLAVLAWMRTLSDAPALERIATITLLMFGLANVGVPNSVYLHEAWAICFIALSLAFYRRLGVCLAFAMIAVLIRETSIIYAIAMGLLALMTRDWKRALFLIAMGIMSAGFWLLHALMVSQVVTAEDPVSPGWIASGGIPMVLAAAQWNIITSQLSGGALAVVVSILLLSLIAVKRVELRVAAVFVALFSFVLLFLGRADNAYWGIMTAPFLALGLPSAMQRLIGSYRARRRQHQNQT